MPWRLLATMTSDIPSSTPCCSAICSSRLPISFCCWANWRWMLLISASIRSLTTPRSAIATPSMIPIASARKTEMSEMRWYLRSGTALDAQEEPQFNREYLEDVGQGVGGVDYRRDRHQTGDDERDELPHRDARRVEFADPFGVHQSGTDLQAGQEGGGGSLATLVQKLHKPDVGADGHDELRPALLGDQDGDVLRQPRHRERLGPLYARGLHAPQARGLPIGVGVDENAVGQPQALGGDGIHVTEDEIRLPSGLEQGVRPTVDADEKGAHLAQVGLERREVLPVVVAAHDHEHLAAAHLAREVVRDLEFGEEEVLLVLHELHRILSEALEGRANHQPALAQPALRGLLVEVLAYRDQLPVLVYTVAAKLDLIPRRKPLEDLLADPVEDVHAGPRQNKRPHVRVLARR